MRMTHALSFWLAGLALAVSGCFSSTADDVASETGDTTGDGDGDGDTGDGDGDTGDGDGDGDTGDGDGDTGDGDGDSGDGDGDTGPMCSPEETNCGGECATLDENPDHCGACMHSCVGGVCNTGVC